MSGVYIAYGDIAIGAKESAVVEANEKPEFVNLSQLKADKLVVKNYGNPLEYYQTVLDGSQSILPNDLENTNLGYWSESITNSEKSFTEPIVLSFTTNGKYTSQGFTITFDKGNNIYCTSLKITWYDGDNKIYEKGFSPDSAEYFCSNHAEKFTKAIIEFYSLNMPYNRLKVQAIEYGYGTIITGSELRNVKLVQEVNPISTEIPISTCDFALEGKKGFPYNFQQGQPLSIYNKDKLKAVTFIKGYKRKSETLWNIESEDYIGVLDRIPFPGGIYDGKPNKDLFKEIFKIAGVPYRIATNVPSFLIYGYIPYTTCRNALMQVALASRAVIDTSYDGSVAVLNFGKTFNEVSVQANRIMQGENYDEEEAVTSVEVIEHSYTPTDESITVYDATESGTGDNIFIKFDEPLHSLSITEGEILESGSNYAVIEANEGCVLVGKKYQHGTRLKTKKNDAAPSNVERIVAIENATLVSSYNSTDVLNYCFDWLTKTRKINLRIAERKHVTEGEPIKYGEKKYGTFKYGGRQPSIITYDTPVELRDKIIADVSYIGHVEGRAIRQSYTLGGGIIVKDMVLR